MSSRMFDQSRKGARLQTAHGKSGSRRIAVLATLTALAVGLRGALDLFGEVTYWNPQTPRDYAAVVLSSIAFLLLGSTLWAIGQDWKGRKTKTGRMARFRRFSIAVAGIAAVVISVSNFLEDYLLMRWFGATFVAGSLVLFVALLVATLARFAAPPRKETAEAFLLLAITAGVIFSALSPFPAVAALLAAAAYYSFGLRRGRDQADPAMA